MQRWREWSRSVRRPCDRLGSHPRASAGPLLRLADRPARRAGIDDARLRWPQAADTQSYAPHVPPKEAAGVAASARGRRRNGGVNGHTEFAGPAIVSGRIPAQARGPCSTSPISPPDGRGSTTRGCDRRRRPTVDITHPGDGARRPRHRAPGRCRRQASLPNQASRSRSVTTLPTMMSVGGLRCARAARPGSVASVPVTTRWSREVPCWTTATGVVRGSPCSIWRSHSAGSAVRPM